MGFIALFGICMKNGVILISEFHNNLKEKMSLIGSIFLAVKVRTRPVVMTALMVAMGLLPAAISTGIGSESQKPLAIVIVSGLVTATIFTLLVFPILYFWAVKSKHFKIDKMPTISMFFGIIDRMYFCPKEHNPPHIHVY